MNIYQKINEVMKKGIYVKKDSAGQGTGIKYDDLIADLAPALTEVGIVVVPEKVGDSRSRLSKSGGYIYECDFNIHYINIEKPEDRFTVLIEGHGMDGSDKATGKALTYATKASLAKVFSIESGDNEESREELRESMEGLKPISAIQLEGLNKLIIETDTDTQKLMSTAGINKCLHELNEAEHYQLTQMLNQKKARG